MADRAGRWTGALLVGGRSRRMGFDKLEAALPDGSRLVDKTAAALRSVCSPCFAIGDRLAASPLPDGFVPLADAEEGAGPLAGLVAALEAAETPWVLLLAADMPEIDGDLLAALQAEAEKDPGRALVPESERGLEPLAAAYPTSLAAPLRARLDDGSRAVHRVLALEERRVWTYAAVQAAARIGRPFRNLNAPEDWRDFTGPR